MSHICVSPNEPALYMWGGNIYTCLFFLTELIKSQSFQHSFCQQENSLSLVTPELAPELQGKPIESLGLKGPQLLHQLLSKHSNYLQVNSPINYLCNIHQLTRQLLNFIFTPQDTHIVLIGPAIKQDTRHCGSNSCGKVSTVVIYFHRSTLTNHLTHLSGLFCLTCVLLWPNLQEKKKLFSRKTPDFWFNCKWSDSSTRVVIVESSNVEGFRSPSAELKPNRRHWRQFGAKHFGNIVSMRIPLQGGK